MSLRGKKSTAKTVSTTRTFKQVSVDKLDELKTRWIKKRIFNKMQWGVRAFNSWRSSKISDPNGFDVIIFDCDLNKLDSVMKFGLNYSLCRFIPEVTKCKDGSDYLGKTLYEMIVSIQKYLHQHDKPWKIIEDPEFLDVKTVLDNTMKERASNNIGMLKKQVQVITYDHENKLWADGIWGKMDLQSYVIQSCFYWGST